MSRLWPAVFGLLATGCAETSLLAGDGFIDRPEPDAGTLCLDTEPGLLTVESTPGVEAAGALTVQLMADLTNCPVREVYLDDLTLDDPVGSFQVDPIDEPVLVDEFNPIELELRLLADEAGSYEALLLISGFSDAGEGGISVELRGQVVEAE